MQVLDITDTKLWIIHHNAKSY